MSPFAFMTLDKGRDKEWVGLETTSISKSVLSSVYGCTEVIRQIVLCNRYALFVFRASGLGVRSSFLLCGSLDSFPLFILSSSSSALSLVSLALPS